MNKDQPMGVEPGIALRLVNLLEIVTGAAEQDEDAVLVDDLLLDVGGFTLTKPDGLPVLDGAGG